jgi:hypothetical protein
MLESERLAVVVEPHESSLLTPKVNVFYDSRSRSYIRPETVDLAREDKIVRHELPEKWKVDPIQFMAAAA